MIDEHLAELGAYADVASTTGLPTAVTGDTALHIAARLGSLRAVSALIGAGVDSTARNDADESAIVLLDSTARACAVKLGVQLDELRVVTRRRRKRRQVLADSGAGGTSRAARMREEADDERDAKAQVGLEFEVIAGRDRLGTAASACGAVRSACGARLDHIAKLENAQWKLSVVGSTSSAADLLEMEQRPALEGDCRMAEALQLAIDPETVAPFNHLPIGVVRRLDAIRERGGDASTVVTSASDAMVLEIEAGLELGAAESKPPLRLMPARELGQLSDEDLAEYIEDLENACAILQAAWRGHRVRRVLRRIVFNRAASAIQALVRGCQVRVRPCAIGWTPCRLAPPPPPPRAYAYSSFSLPPGPPEIQRLVCQQICGRYPARSPAVQRARPGPGRPQGRRRQGDHRHRRPRGRAGRHPRPGARRVQPPPLAAVKQLELVRVVAVGRGVRRPRA